MVHPVPQQVSSRSSLGSSSSTRSLPTGFTGWLKTIAVGLALLPQPTLVVPNRSIERNLCQRSNMRHICKGNLGLLRIQMPQITELDMRFLEEIKKGQGLKAKKRKVPAHELTPVQKEIDHKAVIGMVKRAKAGIFSPCDRPILVADNRTHLSIMDGHHTAVACRLIGGEQSALVVEDPQNLLFPELQILYAGESPRVDDGHLLTSTKTDSTKTAPSTPPQKYLLFDYPGSRSGMFSTFISLLGVLDQLEQHPQKYSGLEIDFGDRGTYYEPSKGENWWQYYFQPLRVGKKTEEVKVVSKLERRHYANCAELNFRGMQSRIPRETAHAYWKKYFQVNPDIQKEVDLFISEHFQGKPFISVHYRGTDKVDSTVREASRTSYEEIREEISRQIKGKKAKNVKLFVATDEHAFVSFLEANFPGQIVTTNAARSENGQPVHMRGENPYLRGKEALIDCLLLAAGDVLIRTSSNLSLFATFINPSIPVIEMNERIPSTINLIMGDALRTQNLEKC